MTRLERAREFFARQGVRFLLLELVIVFLGVYGAFMLQSWSEDRLLDAEREKVLVGVKEDLEYFRVIFPGFTSREIVEERRALIEEGRYRDYSDWRFLQPQYDYTAIEYALEAGADIVDYELNSGLAELYQELQKLRYTEDLITRLAMDYRAIPAGSLDDPVVRMAHENNFLGFRRLNDRARDRVVIMDRISEISTRLLPGIDAAFRAGQLREIELELIRKRIESQPEAEREFYLGLISEYFPDISPEEIRDALR